MAVANTYTIVRRYLVPDKGWQHEVEVVAGSFEAACYAASLDAHRLDERFGGDHFWTVDLKGVHGSYLQLFHGRLE